jgi:hypothetical protein
MRLMPPIGALGAIQMSNKYKFKQVFTDHLDVWDHDGVRPAARNCIRKMIECGTEAFGANVYASFSGERLIVPYTCKGAACSSCGQRTIRDWQRAIDRDLLDIAYKGILFTMPNVLWGIFRENRHLLPKLPTIAADVLQDWADREHGARVVIIAVLHTFGSQLEFNPHVHLIVSSEGLGMSGDRLVRHVEWNLCYVKGAIMKRWRHAVVDYLLTALDRGLISSSSRSESVLRAFFKYQRGLWWFAGVRDCRSRRDLVNYVSRYLRRPPIALHKILSYDRKMVSFWFRNKKTNRREVKEYSVREFILLFIDQIPDRYKHGVHYSGLLAPRCKGGAYEALRTLLKQKRRPRPLRTPWRKFIWLTFKRDPLRTLKGEIMQKIGWLPPEQHKTAMGQILKR